MTGSGLFHLVAGLLLLSWGSAFTFLQQQKVANQVGVAFRPEAKVTQCRPRQEVTLTVRPPTCLFESSTGVQGGGSYVEADDIAAIQQVFNKYCDKDGLMTKKALTEMSPFSDMLSDEDLLMEELEDIWNAAPKFPDVAGEETRIDVDSFVQIYRDVDDLFENDGEGDTDEAQVAQESSAAAAAVAVDRHDDSEIDAEDETVEAELERVYETLCDAAGLVSKETLKAWDEIQKLLDEGLLGEDEFNDLWAKTKKSPGSSELDVDGFLSFNVALDALFEFEDEDGEEEEEEESATESAGAPVARKMVQGGDLPPGVLFAELADEDYLVGMDELNYWIELQEMLAGGDLLLSELQDSYDRVKKTESGKLDEEGFIKLYEEIDSLFEEDEEDIESSPDTSNSKKVKEDLVAFLDLIIEEDTLPCGLECTEKDQKQVLNIVQVLENQPTNIISMKKGNIDLNDLAGTWELLYSSSSAMKFNQGLSGLGGSVPNGKFGGLKQILKASKFLTDVEYKERIEVTPSSASFDVTVTGNWDIRSSVSLFTGKPSIIVEIEPDRVTYGPTSTRADHWKSLGPMNMLDLTYLDEDFRVMRGCTSADTVFIFKKVAGAS